MSDAELRDERLKLKQMENDKKRATHADKEAAVTVLDVPEVKGELDKVVEKPNEFEHNVRSVEA